MQIIDSLGSPEQNITAGEKQKLERFTQRMHSPARGLQNAIYYPILAITGFPTSLAAVVVLSRGRCGLSKCVTYYLVAMAVTDLLVIVTAMILNRITAVFFGNSLLSLTPACSLSTVLIYFSRDCSVWLTVAFTFDRFVAICCLELKRRYCNDKCAAVVISVVCFLTTVKNVPYYFVYRPLYILDGVSWFCDYKLSFYTEPVWIAYDWLDQLLAPCIPLLLILLFNVLTIRHILLSNRVRRGLRGEKEGKNLDDIETEKRKKSMILLFTISASFLLLWITYVINFVYVKIKGGSYVSGFNFRDPLYILQESGNMLSNLSFCTNSFIYAITQANFREELKKTLKYPMTAVTSCFTKQK